MGRIDRGFSSGVAHTPTFEALRRAFRIAAYSGRPDAPPADELIEMHREAIVSRRAFLKGTAATALVVGAGGLLTACRKELDSPGADAPRIVVVGGGIAGLNTAYRLKEQGVRATIYEGSSRTGGRIFTARDIMGPGLTTELGAEFIDSHHAEMLRLVSELGLTLLDTRAPGEAALASEVFYLEGRRFTERQVIEEFRAPARVVASHYAAAPDVVNYRSGEALQPFDRMSIREYFDSIGLSGWLRKLLDVAYETEYGLTTDRQSALNFLFLLATDMDYSDGSFKIFGESDERYKVKGGNQLVVDGLARKLAEHIRTGHVLEAIRSRGDGFTLTFRQGNGSATDVDADIAVITIPFTMLRNVDMKGVTLPEVKKRAIAELGYGTNTKIMAGFDRRFWRTSPYDGHPGVTGYYLTDEACQTGWDNSQLQSGEGGGFTFYLGGPSGERAGEGTAASQVDALMPGFEKIFPGASAARNARAERFHWPGHPFTRGSYACYGPGQWTTIAGAEGEPVGNLFFAGEHCSYDFQGFMNGGAETGRATAEAVLAAVGVRRTGARPAEVR